MLIGLGLGPGDPGLLTLRAVQILESADVVYVPGRVAASLVAPWRQAEILEFPMTDDESTIRISLERNADRIASEVRSDGGDRLVVLGILGDPNFYSTFSRLCAVLDERHPGIARRTEPGVSAITAFASVAGVNLQDGFAVTDGGEPSDRVLLKVRRPREAAERLRLEGFAELVLVERMFMEGTQVYRDGEFPEESDYFSVLFARR
ncbi:MAG: cobalt-factor II C(20)-methyltransferase [Methanospirillum sp.]|nr:cobalt-factor II C(20)-methyltransferase [Methanospirillum sp.]